MSISRDIMLLLGVQVVAAAAAATVRLTDKIDYVMTVIVRALEKLIINEFYSIWHFESPCESECNKI